MKLAQPIAVVILVVASSCAPSRCIARAVPQAMERLLATPTIRIFLSCKKPMGESFFTV